MTVNWKTTNSSNLCQDTLEDLNVANWASVLWYRLVDSVALAFTVYISLQASWYIDWKMEYVRLDLKTL